MTLCPNYKRPFLRLQEITYAHLVTQNSRPKKIKALYRTQLHKYIQSQSILKCGVKRSKCSFGFSSLQAPSDKNMKTATRVLFIMEITFISTNMNQYCNRQSSMTID